MKIGDGLIALGFLAGSVLGTVSAEASTYSFGLSGDMSTVHFNNNPGPTPNTIFQTQWLNLTDTATGLGQLSPFTLNVGDTINVTVSLNGPMTIPGNLRGIGFDLFDTPTSDDEIDVQQSISFLNGGALVSLPASIPNHGYIGFLGGATLLVAPQFPALLSTRSHTRRSLPQS